MATPVGFPVFRGCFPAKGRQSACDSRLAREVENVSTPGLCGESGRSTRAEGPACAGARRHEGRTHTGCPVPPGLIRPHPPQLLPRPFHREVNRGMERGLLSSATQQEVFSTDEHHPSDSEARTPPAHAPTHLQTPPLRSAPPRSDVAGPVTSRLWDEHLVRGAPGSPRPSHRGTTW